MEFFGFCVGTMVIILILVWFLSISINKDNLERAYYNFSVESWNREQKCRKIVHDAKEKAWQEYKFSIDGYSYKSPSVKVDMYNNELVKELFLEVSERIQSEKDEYKRKEEERKKMNERYKRWGQSYLCVYEKNFPTNNQLKELIDLKLIYGSIQQHEDKIETEGTLFEKRYERYYENIDCLILAIAQQQAKIYTLFGVDDNAQGVIELKHEWKDLPDVIIPKGEEFPVEWFPYPDMDRAYFED